MKQLLVVLTLGLLCGNVFAQDASDVRAAIERHYAAIHGADSESIVSHHLPEFTIFPYDGRMLLESGFSQSMERTGVKMDYGTTNTYINHFNAQLYGNVAVATFYLVGSHEWQGQKDVGAWRVTAVWVEEDGEWKEAHHHESPLKIWRE